MSVQSLIQAVRWVLLLSWSLPIVLHAPAPPPPTMEDVIHNHNRRIKVPAVRWEYRFATSQWAMTNITSMIIKEATRAWQDELQSLPTVTGTTHGAAYIHDTDHLRGCAVDLRTWGLRKSQAIDVSQRLTAYLLERVSWQPRVVLWHDHGRRPDHIHVAIQNCGQPIKGSIRPIWSLNGQ